MAKTTNMVVSDSEVKSLKEGFQSTLDTIDTLKELDTSKTPITYQVTGLTNVFREDKVNSKTAFTQKQALLNAKKTYRGYFVIPAIFS